MHPPEDLVSISDKELQGDMTPLSKGQLSAPPEDLQYQSTFIHDDRLETPNLGSRNYEQGFGRHGETF